MSEFDKAQEEINRGFGRLSALGHEGYDTYSAPVEFELDALGDSEEWRQMVEMNFASARDSALRIIGAWIDGYRGAKQSVEGDDDAGDG